MSQCLCFCCRIYLTKQQPLKNDQILHKIFQGYLNFSFLKDHRDYKYFLGTNIPVER